MNAFLAIMCFAYLTTAAANGGYNYQQGKPAAQQNLRPSASIGNSGIYSAQQAPPLPSFNVQSPSQQQQQQLVSAPSQLYAPQFNGPSPQYAGSYQQQSGYAPNFGSSPQYNNQPQYSGQVQQQTIVSKDIYIHSAPEEVEEINPEQGAEAPIRKNYRIVFIKAPSQNIRINSLKRTQASNEEKTIIYVLSKKPDITNIQNQFVQTEQKASKPEVYFIKYKTQEEANRAQKEIQAQYDALGGSTSVSDEGIAPVTSVIGGGPFNSGSAGAAFGSGSSNGPSFAGGSSFLQAAGSNQQNFVQPASSNQQNFIQSSFSGSQGSASSSLGIGVEAPSKKYLPAKKK